VILHMEIREIRIEKGGKYHEGEKPPDVSLYVVYYLTGVQILAL
jgi:hypothetical protein